MKILCLFIVLKKGLTSKMCTCSVSSNQISLPFNCLCIWILFKTPSRYPCFIFLFIQLLKKTKPVIFKASPFCLGNQRWNAILLPTLKINRLHGQRFFPLFMSSWSNFTQLAKNKIPQKTPNLTADFIVVAICGTVGIAGTNVGGALPHEGHLG